MRQPNTTAADMLASGQWAKCGKRAYRHASGIEVRHDGAGWVVTGGGRYVALWTARHVAEWRADASSNAG